MRQHAGVLVCPPYANRPFATFPLRQFAARRMIPTQLPILRPALPSRNLTPGAHSNPIGPRPPRQRLPPSLLIENASDPVFRPRHLSCPRRFRSRLATTRPSGFSPRNAPNSIRRPWHAVIRRSVLRPRNRLRGDLPHQDFINNVMDQKQTSGPHRHEPVLAHAFRVARDSGIILWIS